MITKLSDQQHYSITERRWKRKLSLCSRQKSPVRHNWWVIDSLFFLCYHAVTFVIYNMKTNDYVFVVKRRWFWRESDETNNDCVTCHCCGAQVSHILHLLEQYRFNGKILAFRSLKKTVFMLFNTGNAWSRYHW